MRVDLGSFGLKVIVTGGPPINMSDYESEIDIFKEPDGYREAEKPHTHQSFTSRHGKSITVRLVGQNPLWVRIF